MIVAAYLIALAATAHDDDVKAVWKIAEPSVVRIVCLDKGMRPFASGSGFSVKGGTMTAGHVTEGCTAVKIIKGDKSWISYRWVNSTTADAAIVKGTTSIPTLAIADDVLKIGDTVYCISHPLGLANDVISKGFVNQGYDDGMLGFSAAISPGSSGSAVLNARGEVVGMTLAAYVGTPNLFYMGTADSFRDLIGA